MTPTVLIAAPISNRAWCLERYMASLLALDYPKDHIRFLFLVNDSNDETYKMLENYAHDFRGIYQSFEVNIVSVSPLAALEHEWNGPRLSRMVMLRNKILDSARNYGKVDYLFQVDSDIVFESPDMLAHLIRAEVPIISPVFWATWGMPKNPPLPNVWQKGQYEVSHSFLDGLKSPGHHFVGGLGAATLIHLVHLPEYVDYSLIYNLPSVMWGEDRNFCIRAAVAGISLQACTCYPVKHLEK